MTPMHIALLASIAVAVFATGIVLGLCITAKRADEAISEALKAQTCTRPAPHICTINGPCNGYPKETL